MILLDRRIKISLGLEGATEIDMHLELLAFGGFLVEIGSRTGNSSLIGVRRLDRRRVQAPSLQVAAVRSHSPPPLAPSPPPETRARSRAVVAAWSDPSIV